MPWQEVNTVDLRTEFVTIAQMKTLSMSELCRRFSISRKTGYKWLARYKQEGLSGLQDQSRRPHHHPIQTSPQTEALILAARDRYPDWGGRKLKRVLENQGYKCLPSPSTITEILRRNGRLKEPSQQALPFIRFEHAQPNDLWQMDFKGHFCVAHQRCHPLTVLDDHSRYSLCLEALGDECTDTVKRALVRSFRRYGLPIRMTMDNGTPWGGGGTSRYSRLTVWLVEQGITVSHSRPYHPQTQGKDERFHRTLKTELLGRRAFCSLMQCQRQFDRWRVTYNTVRPHEALGLDTPASRYRPSSRAFVLNQSPYEYGVRDQVRKVARDQTLRFKGYKILIGNAFVGKYLAFRPTAVDGAFKIFFCHQNIGRIDLRKANKENMLPMFPNRL